MKKKLGKNSLATRVGHWRGSNQKMDGKLSNLFEISNS